MNRAFRQCQAWLVIASSLSPAMCRKRRRPKCTKAPVAAGGGLCGLSADQLSRSAYPTPPPKGGAHVQRCGGRVANCSWRDGCRLWAQVSIPPAPQSALFHLAQLRRSARLFQGIRLLFLKPCAEGVSFLNCSKRIFDLHPPQRRGL